MGNFLVSLHDRYVDDIADLLVYGFLAGVGLICSVTVMFEIVIKAIVGDAASWSALRLMGPQIWFPLDSDEDYMLATIVFVYALMYFRACMLLGRAAWKKQKDLSIPWRMYEIGVMLYQITVGILTREHFRVIDAVVLGFDTGGGALAVLFTFIAESSWPDRRTGGRRADARPPQEVLGEDAPRSRRSSAASGTEGQRSPPSGRTSQADRSEVDRTMRMLYHDSGKEQSPGRAATTAMERAVAGSVHITEAVIHWSNQEAEMHLDDIPSSPTEFERVMERKGVARGNTQQTNPPATATATQQPEEVETTDSPSPARSEEDQSTPEQESDSPDGSDTQFTPTPKGKFTGKTKAKSSRRRIRTLPEIAEEGSTEELVTVACASESPLEVQTTEL